MSTIVPSPPKVDVDFTDAQMTAHGGWALLARSLARRLAPAVATHEVRRCGYVPVFVDGSAIEVDGALFEGAGRG